MPVPATIDDFLDVVRKSNQIDKDRLDAYLNGHRRNDTLPPDPRKLASLLIREGLITNFQAEQFLQGKYRGFQLGGYRIIERLGSGGTGTVYLAEHEVMKRRVAIKVLTPQLAGDPAVLERFRREAQAVAALDHPNIVRAYDFRKEGVLHFLVMEFVDGPSLQDVLQRDGALPVPVACEYIRQAALGLQSAHEANLVHRDVKPANLLVDATGAVKLLDLGLARFSPEGQESVTKKFDENMVMGTADYLAPEQALNLHDVDLRADVYSLGATLYALLAGEPPFHAGTVTQKLLWHQMRDPKPLHERRADVPDELVEVVEMMMAKTPDERYQSCAEVAEALAPFAGGPTPQAMPASGPGSRANGASPYVRSSGGPSSSSRRRRVTPLGDSPVSHSSAVSGEPSASEDYVGHRRELPDLRKPVDETGSHVAAMMLLGGVMTVILLVVAGVVAFVIWGPQPNAQVVREGEPDKDKDKEKAKAAAVPVAPGTWRPPPGVALRHQVGLIDSWKDAQGTERLAFSPEGRRIVTAGADHRVRVWDLAPRSLLHTLDAHQGRVNWVNFSRDGIRILSAGSEGVAWIRELPGGRELRRFSTPGKALWCAVFTPDERFVVTAGDDPTLRLWDTTTGNKARDLPGHTQTVNWVACRPRGGNHALSVSWDSRMLLWDLGSGKSFRTFPHPTRALTCAFTPDGNRAVSGAGDGKVRLWDVNSGTGKPLHVFDGHKDEVWVVAISPNGQRCVSAGKDRNIQVWDLAHGRKERSFDNQPAPVTGLAFSPDGRHLVSSCQNGDIRLWGLP